MTFNINRQTGFGLLELLLVLAIAALLIILGLRMYEKQRMYENFDESKKTVQLLLRAANNYYYAYCAQDINGQSQTMQNIMPGYYDQYQRATTMLTDPTYLTVNPIVASQKGYSNLQAPDQFNNQFLESNIPTFFPFGQFTNGEMYQIQLTYKPQTYLSNNCASTSDDKILSPNPADVPQNCFAQTALWQVQVSACVTAFTTYTPDPQDPKDPHKGKYTPPSDDMIKGMFEPTGPKPYVYNDPSCPHGDIITWESIPSIRQNEFSDQGDMILSADQREFNQMYRYGPWMQQGALAGNLKARLEYLCQ